MLCSSCSVCAFAVVDASVEVSGTWCVAWCGCGLV